MTHGGDSGTSCFEYQNPRVCPSPLGISLTSAYDATDCGCLSCHQTESQKIVMIDYIRKQCKPLKNRWPKGKFDKKEGHVEVVIVLKGWSIIEQTVRAAS